MRKILCIYFHRLLEMHEIAREGRWCIGLRWTCYDFTLPLFRRFRNAILKTLLFSFIVKVIFGQWRGILDDENRVEIPWTHIFSFMECEFILCSTVDFLRLTSTELRFVWNRNVSTSISTDRRRFYPREVPSNACIHDGKIGRAPSNIGCVHS